MLRRMKLIAAVGCSLITAAVCLHADVKLPALISDSMVLQQGVKANFWGTADPGEHISVSLNDQQADAITDSSGQWSVKLGPLKAGGPFPLTITGKNKITLHDVLVGEVWVCSGQSNMAMTVGPTMPPYFTGVIDFQNEVHNANYPMLHLFTVQKTIASKPQHDVKGYWTAARPDSVNDFSAVGYFFGRELLKALNVPVGIVCASQGSTTAETWTSRGALEADPEFKSILDNEPKLLAPYPKVFTDYEAKYAEWKKDAEESERKGNPIAAAPSFPKDPRQSIDRPAVLFNGMIAPLTSYTIKGVIWYQGESNTERPMQYRKLFPALIRDWRRAWGQGDFPFLYVQLASWGIQYFQLKFPELREAQTMALSLPNIGMAVTTDIGDGTDGHPKNKQDIGYRLALAARAIAYGQDVIYQGPTFDSMTIEGDTAHVHFKNATGGMSVKNWPPGYRSGFEIAGEDRRFVEAQSVLDGETFHVRSDLIKKPVAIRLNWKDQPWYHVYNHAGLPAVPFRTDNWTDPNSPNQ
jgi:sialate O-acetylesterase